MITPIRYTSYKRLLSVGAFEAKNSISGTNPPLDYASFNLNENKKFLTLKIFSEELLVVGLEVFRKKM